MRSHPQAGFGSRLLGGDAPFRRRKSYVPREPSRLRLPWDYPQTVLGPLFWAAFRATAQQQRGWCYPSGPAVVSIPGIDPVRILLIGDAPAAGCGVLIHDLGIAGTLARYVAADTKRGVVVAVSAQPDASASSTLKHLAGLDLVGYDSIVLMLATTDAFCLTSRRSWQRSTAGLIQELTSAGTASVFVTSTASMQLTRSLSPLARRLTGNHARLLNVETFRICAQSGVPMIPLDAANDLSPGTYAKWGRRIGAYIVNEVRA